MGTVASQSQKMKNDASQLQKMKKNMIAAASSGEWSQIDAFGPVLKNTSLDEDGNRALHYIAWLAPDSRTSASTIHHLHDEKVDIDARK